MSIKTTSGAPLLEIRRRGQLIAETIRGMGYQEYVVDDLRQAAIERHLEVIGEALRRIADDDPPTLNRIDASRGFIGLRNVIAHGYDRLVQRRIWEAVTQELPVALTEVDELLEELGVTA